MNRVALVDDHALIRGGIRALINSLEGFEVVAEGSDGDEVFSILKTASPDILILDLNMKKVGGLAVMEDISKYHPQVRVLVLSMHTDTENVLSTLRLGAKGYLIKDAAVVEIELALKALMRNEQYLSSGIVQAVVQSAMTVPKSDPEELVQSVLTKRQTEILRLICRGCSARDIAQGLGLSIKTVETHRAQIMQRLDIHDVPSLVVYAIRNGLICLQD